MKTIKALALTALAVAATAAPAAANSFKFAGMKQYTADNFSHPTVKQIANQLQRIGVPILDGLDNGFNQCLPQANGMVAMGFYSPEYDMMVLCTNNGDSSQMVETLIHEATHTAQDCRAGLNNSLMGTSRLAPAYAASLHSREVRMVREVYPSNQHDHEFEARFNEENPQRVVDALAQYCL